MAASHHFEQDQPPNLTDSSYSSRVVYNPTRFHENCLETFCVILFMGKQTERQTLSKSLTPWWR